MTGKIRDAGDTLAKRLQKRSKGKVKGEKNIEDGRIVE